MKNQKIILLDPESLTPIRSVDERMVSYNIEMTEVTGGTFWKAYTPGQIAGTEEFPTLTAAGLKDITAMAELMEYYPPIDLYNEQLRGLAKELGPAWIRVSGSWATKTYYDFDGETGGKAPEGYQSVLTREQWIGVLDFVRAVGGKLLISVSNCAGDHPGSGPLDLSQTKKIFDFSHAYGVDIDAAEFMNEPNMLAFSGAPMGYTPKDHARDQDIFFGWVRQHYPNCLLVGPCATGDPSLPSAGEMSLGNFITKRSYVDMDYVYGTLSNSGGENPLDYQALRDDPMEFYVVAADALTGEPKYFDKECHVHPMKAARVAALCWVFSIVQRKDRPSCGSLCRVLGRHRQAAGEAGTKCRPQERGCHGHGTSMGRLPYTRDQTTYAFCTYRSPFKGGCGIFLFDIFVLHLIGYAIPYIKFTTCPYLLFLRLNFLSFLTGRRYLRISPSTSGWYADGRSFRNLWQMRMAII